MPKFISDRPPFDGFSDQEDTVAWLLLIEGVRSEFSLEDCYGTYSNVVGNRVGAGEFLLRVLPPLVEHRWMTIMKDFESRELLDYSSALQRMEEIKKIIAANPMHLPDDNQFIDWFWTLEVSDQIAIHHPRIELPD